MNTLFSCSKFKVLQEVGGLVVELGKPLARVGSVAFLYCTLTTGYP